MTNYESTVYTVEDEEQDTSAAFSTVPTKNDPTLNEAGAAVMKLWHSTTLPDGQPINVSVLFTLDDVRGLQAYLNDQFGRSRNSVEVLLDPGPDGRIGTALTGLPPDSRFAVTSPAEQQAPRSSEVRDMLADVPPGAILPVGAHRPAGYDGGTVDFYNEEYDPIKPGDKVTVIPAQMRINEGEPKQGYVVVPEQSHESHGSERLATLDGLPGMLEPSDLSGGWADSQPRQCPVIYNGIQCSRAEGHHDSEGRPDRHEFVQDWLTVQPTQTGDGATAPAAVPAPTAVAAAEGQAAESATAVTAAEAPSPSTEQVVQFPLPGGGTTDSLTEAAAAVQADVIANTEPAKKKVNRRKKEEKAYDDALEHFRANPQMQTAYTDLVKAAEALRKRFPDAKRLERYDAHVQMQDVSVLLDTSAQPRTPDPSVAPAPSLAPEPAAQQPTPFVPPIAMPAPEQQSAEELQAAQAFPCQMRSSDGRQCTRPAGHELASPPKPHIYAADVARLAEQQPGFTVTPVNEGSGFTQAAIPPFQIPQPTAPAGGPSTVEWTETPSAPQTTGQQVLSFQVPPTPQVQGAEMQPPAPAAPPWAGA